MEKAIYFTELPMNMLMNEGPNETETTSNVCWMVLSLTSVSLSTPPQLSDCNLIVKVHYVLAKIRHFILIISPIWENIAYVSPCYQIEGK